MREATIRIPHSELEGTGFESFISICLSNGLQNLTELACQKDGCLFVVTLNSELPQTELDEIEGMEWWEKISATGDNVTYLCKMLVITNPSENPGKLQEIEVSNNGMRVNDDGIDVSVVGTQEEISQSIEQYNNEGVEVVLRRISDYTGPETTLDALTERQREVLEKAYELGYFNMPRNASASDVAEELGLSLSTVTEHLHRAEHNLLSKLFNKS